MSLIGPEILLDMVRHAARTPPGAFVEVGVYQGGSAEKLAEVAREQGRALWLFDTFAGMPESTEGLDPHRVGEFADTSADEVRARIPDAHIVVGDARRTLAEASIGPVAFAHVDCDQYATTLAVLQALAWRMIPGGLVWLDDYACVPGATRAVDEFCGRIPHWSGGHHGSGKAFLRF